MLQPVETARISGAVEALVMLGDGRTPLAQPRKQIGCGLGPGLRMATQNVPLALGRLACLVQDGGIDGQLADVVQQRRPAQPILIKASQPQLLAQQVGVDPHPFGVTAGSLVMVGQRCQQLHDGRRRVRRSAVTAGRQPIKSLLRRRPPRHLEPRRRLIGEQHAQLQQHRQRHEPTAATLGHQGSRHRTAHRDGAISPPGSSAAGRQNGTQRPCRQQRAHHRNGDDDALQQRREDRPSLPTMCAGWRFVNRCSALADPPKHRIRIGAYRRSLECRLAGDGDDLVELDETSGDAQNGKPPHREAGASPWRERGLTQTVGSDLAC